MGLYWGDIHNHCGITYGFGSLENALEAAKEQLDFCSVTGHAMWPDIPERKAGLEFLVDFHTNGFNKLKNNWEHVRSTIAKANMPHEFVTFQGYEMHSSIYGDHHIVSTSDELPLIYEKSPYELVKKLTPHECLAILHHPGYTPGYRGANWEAFTNVISPVVEVYSKHGCGVSEDSMYNYMHTMGPRDSRSTAYSGLSRGHRFGFVASTDHHAGYPGSYGDGRMAVVAEEKTREAIFRAMKSRHTYAVTGDKIKCDFKVNGSPFGSEITCNGNRHLELEFEACDFLDKAVIYKNLKPWQVINGESIINNCAAPKSYKIRVEMGWGNSSDGYPWEGTVKVESGVIRSLETCFRGKSVLAPSPEMKENPEINALNNKVRSSNETMVSWTCTTFKNPMPQYSQTNALIFEVEGDEKTTMGVTCNGKSMKVSIGDLLKGSRSFHIEEYNSEAVVIHHAVPNTSYVYKDEWIDAIKDSECDIYHVELRQVNGQSAWISPVFVV